jgi:hypothetical protein
MAAEAVVVSEYAIAIRFRMAWMSFRSYTGILSRL